METEFHIEIETIDSGADSGNSARTGGSVSEIEGQACCTVLPKKAPSEPYDAAFIAQFQEQVEKTINEHHLFTKKSKVLVAASGGKDSTALLHVLKNLGYTIEAVTVDARIGCYTEENLKNLRQFCQKINIALHEIDFRNEFGMALCHIRDRLHANGYDYKSCHVCGVLRRYLINKKAKELSPDCIATGHNLDDESQVIMMNLLRSNVECAARLGPKSGLGDDTRFVQRVKPFYFTREVDVVRYAKMMELPVKYGMCPCSSDSYRREIRNIFSIVPNAEQAKENIMKAFMGILPRLKAHYGAQEKTLRECIACSEPTNNELCNACSLLQKIEKVDNKIDNKDKEKAENTKQIETTAPYEQLIVLTP